MNTQDLSLMSHSPEQTQEWGQQLAQLLQGGEVITLRGDLGAGKTSFTQGLAKGLGVKRTVNSPTYTIIKEYMGLRHPLYHMDTYRIEDEDEALGLEEYFYSVGISVVEWPDKITSQLPDARLDIYITKVDEQIRAITFKPSEESYYSLVMRFFKELEDETAGD
jgi:tRNA threonylcarbamoyladenosine biosynthesis protein TsaE